MNVNWKARFKHKPFLVSLLALVLVLANQIAGVFGVDITVFSAEITSISETVLTILGLLGVVIDPTTSGVSDSTQALRYDEPKKDDVK